MTTWRVPEKVHRPPIVYREKLPYTAPLAFVEGSIERAKSHVRRTMREWPYGYSLEYRFENRDICFFFSRDPT